MEYRRLGRSELMVSAVGFGTCQLRLTTQAQAMDTLLKGFELGVNIVHTAPDYGNAEELVARAVQQSGRHVMVASQGYDVPGNATGPVYHFEKLFETTCKLLGAEQLDLYGIACIDDREVHQENVWGKNGMVDFLLKKKEEGRLRGIFCTTHGAPEYIRQLITSGVFDAVMMAYNILGYHLLTCHPPPDRHYESLPRNEKEIFPLCREHDVGVMIMKPLAGGLLCQSDAFPPYGHGKAGPGDLRAADVLRSILLHPEVSCVLPGTASVADAEENALSGYGLMDVGADRGARLKAIVEGLKTTICSRCGACDTMCSQGLAISSIFWAGLMHQYPSAVFEQPESIEYFRLHPQLEPVCAACSTLTCVCPNGINIPRSLKELHFQMVALMRQGLIPPPETCKRKPCGDASFGARMVTVDVPEMMEPGEVRLCRLLVENAGERGWHPMDKVHQARVMLGVFVEGERIHAIEVAQDVHKGGRWHFAFEVMAPLDADCFQLDLKLLGEHQHFSEVLGPILFSKNVPVRSTTDPTPFKRWTARRMVQGKALDPIRPLFMKQGVNKMIGSRSIAWRRALSPLRFVRALRQSKGGRGWDSLPVVNPAVNSLDETVSMKPYNVAWLDHNLPVSFPRGEPYQVYLHVENRGSRHWHAAHAEGRWVELVIYIGDVLHCTSRLPHDVAPGKKALLTSRVTFPDTAENGKWRVTVSFVEQHVAWFHQNGMDPLVVEIQAKEPEKGAIDEAAAAARRSNWGFWFPSQGIVRSRTGLRYPMFIEQAQGCRVRDAEGNEWIDYVMAGGAAILGYAHPEIREAISRQLASSAVTTLPYMLEIKATQILCDMIPCAEMALFGKHGSDMCTVAVRTARLHTGRKKVLFSGYHGWHDWYAETLQPRLRISGEPPTLFRFELNEPSSFRSLVKEHAGEIAAVIIEPAAQATGLDGPVCDADPAFLGEVADTCRQESIVLIFDEIVTGFRHPQGSVQRATGIIPDLACFGKALSAGMPLSALVGRRDIMQTAAQTVYMPTFRGEMYSLAAAVAALGIYKRWDVPAQIHAFGLALKDGINLVTRELNIAGEMIGAPFRMIYRFNEPDGLQRSLKRTLLQQELLQRGIITYQGYMLPSTAHGDPEMEQTIAAFRGALQRVEEVASEQAFVRYLDIPLI